MRRSPPFWTLVDKTETCWLWKGPTNDGGYGCYKGKLAHRVSYKEAGNTLIKGEPLHHTCRMRRCVRPNHLEKTTLSAHVDAMPNLRRTQTVCKNGHTLSGENLIVKIDGYGFVHRECRTCKRKRERDYCR